MENRDFEALLNTDTLWCRCQTRLRGALRITGYVTILSGPGSACRKLCREVIGSNMVTINCREATDPASFWHQVALYACVPAIDLKDSKNQRGDDSYLLKEITLPYYIEHDKVLVVEDFHLACSKMQVFMAQQFKDSVRRGLRIVILLHKSQVDILLRA